MATPKFIFTADDYGPIPFINKGICNAVQEGLINSVHVLVNGDEKKLLQNLKQLSNSVPENKTLDIGLHLTLTSGKPISGTPHEWGDSLDKYENFKKYTKFNFQFKLDLIRKEFAAQKQRLEKALAEIDSPKLVFTSVSHHHNMLIISPHLIKAYKEVAGDNLALRAPKMPPKSRRLYYRILSLFNWSETHCQRREMRKLYLHFLKNEYYGPQSMRIKSPSYVDSQFYNSLGSLWQVPVNKFRINSRLRKFRKMMKRANSYWVNPELESRSTPLIEFPFHLGDINEKVYKSMTAHYTGINHKFFDDRKVEFKTLQKLKSDPDYQNVFSSLETWERCGEVSYL